jgi:Kae1-associated kinase Bud32
MEYVRGRTLKLVFDDAELPSATKLAYASKLGATVGMLHDAGLAHGDLTTSNVMVRDAASDRLTVIDFGLAFSTKSSEDMGVDLYVQLFAFEWE